VGKVFDANSVDVGVGRDAGSLLELLCIFLVIVDHSLSWPALLTRHGVAMLPDHTATDFIAHWTGFGATRYAPINTGYRRRY
jgi:hypothetical protein